MKAQINKLSLPIENLRDLINLIRQDIKYKLIPNRLYYKYRAKKYAKYKTPELNLIQHLVHKDQISLDIGANLGLFTFFMAKYSRKVFAFEPNPYPLRYLPSLIDDNVELIRVAVGKTNELLDLLIPKSEKGWSSNGATLKSINVKNGIKIRVDCRTIDSFNFSNVGLIKIDVEGAEKDVLEGSGDTIRKNKPNLIFENEIVHQKNTNDIFEIIKSHEYEIFYFYNNKLRKMDNKFLIADNQKTPEEKIIGYIQNFIGIHKENILNYSEIII